MMMVDKSPELRRNPEAAADMAANAVCHYLRESGVTGRPAKRQWIAGVFERVEAKEFAT